jgi:integrase/recombinase XerD
VVYLVRERWPLIVFLFFPFFRRRGPSPLTRRPRSLFSYLQTYGYTGVDPAHGDFVEAPPVPRDGKTVGLSPEDCRRLLDAPPDSTAAGVRDRALLALLAYTGCRVGELARLKVGSYKTAGGHKVLEVHGKGGKERRVPLHPEAFERLEAWP